MERKNYLFLHKDEWNRLKNIGTPVLEQCKTNEYLESLIEKSQQWINSWPDSLQAHIMKLEKKKERQLAKDMAMIKLCKQRQKETEKKNKSIEKAKQIIFDDSCYGRRLISALLESKALEERDVQIEFQKKIKENALDAEHNATECSLQNPFVKKNPEEQERCKREKTKEVARVNKNIYRTQNENKKNDKEKEKRLEIEDLKLITKLNEIDAAIEAKQKTDFIQQLKQFEADRRTAIHNKLLREYEEQRKIDIWRKYEDKKNALIKKMHEKRFDKSQSMKNYELVERLNDEKQKRYDDFVNKGITALTQRLQIKEEEDNRKNVKEQKRKYLLALSNKLEAERRIIETDKIMCSCDRQCIIPKCTKNPGAKPFFQGKGVARFEQLEKTMVDNPKIKEKEQSSWSGASAAHAQFAHQAGRTLRECRYKHAARKVVDDYRRSYGLQPEDLPIENYL